MVPCAIDTKFVESTREKSPRFALGAGVADCPEPPPQPQEYNPTRRSTEDTNAERAAESGKVQRNLGIPDEAARARKDVKPARKNLGFWEGNPKDVTELDE